MMWSQLAQKMEQGDVKSLARAISLVENEYPGYEAFMAALPQGSQPVIGITGPPGAGKSTLTDALIESMIAEGKRIAVLCVDPSSPFHLGALLGDRIRMSRWFNSEQVYIRSLASRGSLGGLHPKILEITDLLKAAPFDMVLVETVGVGQSEIEIAGLADVTIVVLVPEAGDEIQTMKAGLMEIADIFVVNKSDRPGADLFAKNLRQMLAPAFQNKRSELQVIKTVASTHEGVASLYQALLVEAEHAQASDRKIWLLVEKAWQLIQQKRMRELDKNQIKEKIEAVGNDFNLYRFVHQIS